MGLCEDCNLRCTVATTGKCTKTETIIGRIVQKWNNKEQQTPLSEVAV